MPANLEPARGAAILVPVEAQGRFASDESNLFDRREFDTVGHGKRRPQERLAIRSIVLMNVYADQRSSRLRQEGHPVDAIRIWIAEGRTDQLERVAVAGIGVSADNVVGGVERCVLACRGCGPVFVLVRLFVSRCLLR